MRLDAVNDAFPVRARAASPRHGARADEAGTSFTAVAQALDESRGVPPVSGSDRPGDAAAAKLMELLLAHSLREMLPDTGEGEGGLAFAIWRGLLADVLAERAAPAMAEGPFGASVARAGGAGSQ